MFYPYSDQSSSRAMEEIPKCSEDNYYVAQTGDTLYAISRFYNVSLDDLIEANPSIKPELIIPGEVIYIPLATPPVNCPIGASTYIVQKGDTFYSIAKRYKMRLSSLLKANPNINPDALLIGQSICIPMISSSYTNKTYRIKLMHPYLWSKIDDERYEGIGGFFQVFAISSDAELDEICSNEAHHKLKPYGTHPTITKAIVDRHEACFIIPSSDQPMEMHSQSALIAKYDKPLGIEGVSYQYLIIWTGRNHLRDIADSLEFLDE